MATKIGIRAGTLLRRSRVGALGGRTVVGQTRAASGRAAAGQ